MFIEIVSHTEGFPQGRIADFAENAAHQARIMIVIHNRIPGCEIKDSSAYRTFSILHLEHGLKGIKGEILDA